MDLRRLMPLALGMAGAFSARQAFADGACVAIDTARDNLMPDERNAVLIAAITALEGEGVVVDTQGRCIGTVTIYNIHIGNIVKTTMWTGQHSVTGQASSIDELDLLVRQLIRSLVTGRMFATGTGVQDRNNVLRDQTAPRRVDPAGRLWTPMVAIGGGMLQLPAIEGRARQRQFDIVSIDARYWGFITDTSNGLEVRARMLLHDYAVLDDADDAYHDSKDGDSTVDGDELGRGLALTFSPLAVANWEMGIGLVHKLGVGNPAPYVRVGGELSILCRFSDPDHVFDVGPGFYAGTGLLLTDTVSLAVEANISRPMFHSAYNYFLTTTAMIEFRFEPELGGPFIDQGPPTIRRIRE